METDKNITGLFADYEKLFSSLKQKPIKYLEIGVAAGGSMVWADKLFTNVEIIGVDIETPKVIPERAKFLNINQNDSKALQALGRVYGDFDIIIDDASHFKKETENTFICLYPFLKKGGFYIIEDWGIGYYPQWGEIGKGMEKLVVDLIWMNGGIVKRNKSGGTWARINKG